MLLIGDSDYVAIDTDGVTWCANNSLDEECRWISWIPEDDYISWFWLM